MACPSPSSCTVSKFLLDSCLSRSKAQQSSAAWSSERQRDLTAATWGAGELLEPPASLSTERPAAHACHCQGCRQLVTGAQATLSGSDATRECSRHLGAVAATICRPQAVRLHAASTPSTPACRCAASRGWLLCVSRHVPPVLLGAAAARCRRGCEGAVDLYTAGAWNAPHR